MARKSHGTSNHGNETRGRNMAYAMQEETVCDAGRAWFGIRVVFPECRPDTCRVMRLNEQEDRTMTTRFTLLPQAVLLMVAMLVTGVLPVVSKATETGVAPVGMVSDWQTRRLMQPTEGELLREARGEVVIYDGLTDQQIESALSLHPTRMRSMMFVGTIVTDDDGAPQMDDYGKFVLQDDGC
jgi:hypothetical protein